MPPERFGAPVRLTGMGNNAVLGAGATRPDAGAGTRSSLSFEDFYAAQADTLRRALYLALGDLDVAVDASDEALTRAYEQWGRVRTYDNPTGWVYRVGLNWALSARRRNKWRDDREVPEHLVAAPIGDVDLADALGRLTTDQRVVVVCRYFLDWTVEQTAEALAVRPGTVKSRQSRALDSLHQTLETKP